MRRSKRLNKNTTNDTYETSNEVSAIFRLNEDCMRQIFSFLLIKERIRLARVCKRWQALINLPWTDIKKLKISFADKMDKHKIKYTLPILKQVLGYCGKSVTSLTLGSWREKGFTKPVIMLITKKCPNLRSLDMERMQLYCKAAEVLADSYSNFSHIVLGAQKDCTDAISKLFANNKQLKSVQFNECHQLRSQCFRKLPAKSIESLTFGQNCSFSVSGVLKVLGNFTNLRTLCINRNYQFIVYLDKLLGSLPNKLNLETLSLDSHIISPRSISNVRYLTNLRNIFLIHDIVNDELLTMIGENCKHLSYAYLAYSNALIDSGLKKLVDSSRIEKICLISLRGLSNTWFTCVSVPSLKYFEALDMKQLTNESFRLLMLVSDNLLLLRVHNCQQVNVNILINDALHYTSNRSNQERLRLSIQAVDLVPEIRNISPRLIVELRKTRRYLLDYDSD